MKRVKKNIQQENIKDKAANRIANGILKAQTGFAKYLLSVTKKWNQKHQWIFLYVVCLIFGGLSIMAIVIPFKINQNNSYVLPKFISVPKNIQLQNDEFRITENEFQKVHEYKLNHPGLQNERPALFDSLNLVEQIYYSQKK